MTDTLTTLTVPAAIHGDGRIDTGRQHGFHAPIDLIRAFAADLRPGMLAPHRDRLYAWADQPGVVRNRDFVDRMIDDPASFTDVEDLRMLAGAILSAGIHSLEVAVPSGDSTAPTVEQIRADHVGALAPYADAVRAWGVPRGEPTRWIEWLVGNRAGGADYYDLYERSFVEGRPWQADLESLADQLSTCTPEVTVSTTIEPTITPIGPEHPGWAAFWEQLAEHAESDGYEEQYNVLANAFGAATIDTDEDIEVEYEIRVEPFYVTIRREMRRSEFESGDYDPDFSQSDIDEAVRNYVRHNDVDWEITETTEI